MLRVNNIKCKICKNSNWEVLYRGPIRIGRFGTLSDHDQTVLKCKVCKVGYLDNININYESQDYRNQVDGSSTCENYYRLHDGEQLNKINILKTENIRNKKIADIGCGAGSFLDLIKGYSLQTIAVEPMKDFHKELSTKGHKVYSYCKDALEDWNQKIDIAVSFAVLEHVDDPLLFLKEIKELLKPDGYLLISTPNYDDWLLDFLPIEYGSFFYRTVHTWYFNGESLGELALRAGFNNINIKYIQRFDMSNALFWIRDKEPTGSAKIELFKEIDNCYKNTLVTKGQTDYIYCFFYQ